MKTINTYYENFDDLSEFIRSNQTILYFRDNSAVLIQIFNGQCDHILVEMLLAELNKLMPMAHILGTTTSGEIMNGKVSGLKTVLTFSIFKRTGIRTGFFPKGDLNDFALGLKIGSTLGSNQGKLLILFSTGGAVYSKSVLKGVEALYSGLPVAGGNAGYNASGCFVFCKDQITDCGVVGAVLEGENLQVKSYFNFGWQPIGKEMTITKVDGLRVFAIDDMPAYQVYRKYLGLDSHNFVNAIEYPLLVENHGSLMARTPVLLHNDDSITFGYEWVKGEKVRLSFGDVGLISEEIESLCREIGQYPAESIFVYSCECRRGHYIRKNIRRTGRFRKVSGSYSTTINELFEAISGSSVKRGAMASTFRLFDFCPNRRRNRYHGKKM
jgi:hypothetical protein